MYAHPWKRFGHDRLYVNIDEETQIGYWDRTTDELHPVAPKYADSLAAFIAGWKQGHGIAADEDVEADVSLGRLGELLVDAELTRLEDLDLRWHHRNSIVTGSAGMEIDHLLIGPAGVFTINAKQHHGGTLWVGGDAVVDQQWASYMDHARSDAAHAREVLAQATGLRPAVQGVVVVVGAERLTVNHAPEDVLILQLTDLVEHLMALPEVLSDADVEQLMAAAHHQDVWHAVTA